ncbi:hypothetical protein GXM_03137 [Nostoc sphaeroides CCNUC1]|uniref:Uncharacterized protein n=1 Tax=Nostoc sphaeroides CCNUC1 TaxID=2653204 RepID=A0A5P8VZ33_9NOSO|nr:hypothetical protein GXM_03137 [Nostoc sphaeroides CCNUC1]
MYDSSPLSCTDAIHRLSPVQTRFIASLLYRRDSSPLSCTDAIHRVSPV